jgi:hypothetical protein
MLASENFARGTASSAGSSAGRTELAPAMSLMLALARARSRREDHPGGGVVAGVVDALWELAERYHPEQAWLAASWACGDRTLDDLERHAPREALAPGLKSAVGRLLGGAQDLRPELGFAQE